MTKAGAELAAVAVLLAVSAAGLAGDAARPHLIYLHGRIVQEEQSKRPRHSRFGYYELEKILGASDDSSGPCPPWKDDPGSRSRLFAREIVLKTGLSHGFLYRPIPEWVDPVVDWAGAR